ncbi:hypothetical protein DNTS_029150 [Danionella cerebrum]|uniref:Ras-GAP domain-containing protein n=1 Tax=Danionella cerebrum TaxID=2873325 RepID=A0A553QSB5_9TELE|nr:hypothetical protein DNTS_029150 [Danionella translucida]
MPCADLCDVLGKHISDNNISDVNISTLLRSYYLRRVEEKDDVLEAHLKGRYRRQNFRNTTNSTLLQEKITEVLGSHGNRQLDRLVEDGVKQFVLRFMECPAIIPRCIWGAAPSHAPLAPLSPPLPFLYIHHTAIPSEPCLSLQMCSKNMRAIQHFHQKDKGWHDIGYSFVVGSDGYIYEGRGWLSQGAHTKGRNSVGYGVAFIGDYTNHLPSPHDMELVRHHLVKCGVNYGFLQKNYTILGHRQVVETDCPGDSLYSEITTWKHYKIVISGELQTDTEIRVRSFLKMSSNKDSNTGELQEIEDDMELAPEQNGPVGPDPQRPEVGKVLNTYKWHTRAEMGAHGTFERLEKGATKNWNKMQSWRKALSEDAGEKSSNPTRACESPSKSEKQPRKNPFRRALSEPPGSLFSSLAPGTSGSQASGSSVQDSTQRGKIRKYLQTVSQKFKRPRLQSNLSENVQKEKAEPENVVQEPVHLSWAPPQEVPVWDINNCFLQDGQILIPRDEEPMTKVRNRVSSCLSSISLQNISGSPTELNPDPVVTSSSAKPKGQDGGVRRLIKRHLQGEEKRKSSTQLNTAGLSVATRYGSRESLSIPVSAAKSLDLSEDQSTVIRPVHSSILGEKYCFQVINSENNHCFGCTSAAERDRWIEDLRRSAHPNKDNCERTENSLCLWINEAKDLPPKRRFFCEVHLDGTLFARTSSRPVGKSVQRSSMAIEGVSGASGSGSAAGGCQLFWGEFFELDNLPPVSNITLHLFRGDDPKKKRHSKDESVLHPFGSVHLPLAEIKGRAYQEKWYPIIPYKTPGTGASKDHLGLQASIRVKAKFKNLKILPIERYKEFAEYITVNYVEMCSSLEPLLNVREKEELAGALVHVLQSIGKAKEFLIDLGSAEVQRLGENEALIFRENTLATKAIDEYMKLVGQKYLIDTLGDFIARLYCGGDSCEVDPLKCSPADLPINQRHLKETCEDVVKRITDMEESFPAELKEIFSSWVSDCTDRGQLDIGHHLISASLFLRFLCPAILSPSLFGLTQPYPEPSTLRTLTLTAKVLQNLANFTLFGDKEEYMLFMNEFLQQHWEPMRGFLQSVSDPDSEMAMSRFDGYVDLPLRLAVLHNLLVDILSIMKQDQINNLHPLPSILNQISEFLGNEAQRIHVSRNASNGTTKPIYVPPRDLPKYSPLQTSLQQLPLDPKPKKREPKKVQRAFSVPNRSRQHQQPIKRQASKEELPTQSQDYGLDQDHCLEISPPSNPERSKASAAAKHAQDLAELRMGVEQVTERELEMAKRLEDFIVLTQDQNTQLQVEVQELRNLLAIRDEQLASATFRLGVIEEEREEDERKLNVAVAAVERMTVLEEQFAGLLKDVHQLYTVNTDGIRQTYINT